MFYGGVSGPATTYSRTGTLIDIGVVYPDPSGVIAALENRYCYGSFYTDSPAFLFSAQYSSLVVGDTLYVLSGSGYVVATSGFYAIYPFNESGTESYIQIDDQGRYVGTTTGNIQCNNPGDFNPDFNADFNN